MPSQMTHLAIAKKYLEKNPQAIKDIKAFYDGNVYPDIAPDKAEAHCGVRTEVKNVVKRNIEKVSPQIFLALHDMHDDFNKGQYLHLYTDFQYYNVFLREYFKGVTMSQSSIDLYETTLRDDAYLRDKYQVSYQLTKHSAEVEKINAEWDVEHRERYGYDYKFTIPYDLAQLDQFIESMSDIEMPKSNHLINK